MLHIDNCTLCFDSTENMKLEDVLDVSNPSNPKLHDVTILVGKEREAWEQFKRERDRKEHA